MPDARVKVLIVDDKATIRTTMSLVLNEIGYNVRLSHRRFLRVARDSS